MSKPKNFQELVTKALDMEVTIANCCINSFGFTESKKGRVEWKRNMKFSKNSSTKAMSISTSESNEIMRKLKWEDKKSMPLKDVTKRPPLLK